MNSMGYTLLLGTAFLGIFGVSEVVYRHFHLRGEYTRKFTHLSAGLLTLFFPALIQETWMILMLAGSFLLLLAASKRWHFLPSVNTIDRFSVGSYAYPLGIAAMYLFYKFAGEYIYFGLPVLIMAVCDPIAALVGQRAGKRYLAKKGGKTYLGTFAFFVSAAIISWISLVVLTNWDMQRIALTSILAASFSAMVEAVSGQGIDNITVPLAVEAVLFLLRNII